MPFNDGHFEKNKFSKSWLENSYRPRELSIPPSKSEGYPGMYEISILNDSSTPADFTVFILREFFHKSPEEAVQMVLNIQCYGKALCMVSTREVAESKVLQVTDFARENQYPLECIITKRN